MDQQGGYSNMELGRNSGRESGRDAPGWYLERADGDSLRIPVDQFPFLIGRGIECQIQPASHRVSRIHAELKPSTASGFLFLVDRHSTNGTYLNGHIVREPVPINNTDTLRFGDEEWRLLHGGLDNAATRRMEIITADPADSEDYAPA